MLNKLIISEFTRLIEFIQKDIDTNQDTKLILINKYRLKNIKNALYVIKNYPHKITLDNVDILIKFPNIGKGTINRIKEILLTGKLKELKDFKQTINKKLLDKLESIVGIGHKLAIKLINKGITSIKDLKQKIKNNEIVVNEKLKIGIKYYNKFFGNIPRNEITDIKSLITNIIDDINKEYKLNKNNKYIFEVCGSYRREKSTSGDIDILLSKYNSSENDTTTYLYNFLKKLKQPIEENNNKPLIIDDMTDINVKTKYMGFLKYKNNSIRRIDIRYVPIKYFISAKLYFTGSAQFNQRMRKQAKKLGYKLSEYGLTKKSDNTYVPIKSEKDIFNILKISYIEPKFR